MPHLYVRRGRVFFSIDDVGARAGEPVYFDAEQETPRERARAEHDVAVRWSQYVDLMLAGQRLTGWGKIIQDERIKHD